MILMDLHADGAGLSADQELWATDGKMFGYIETLIPMFLDLSHP